jgi:hypothetical protein
VASERKSPGRIVQHQQRIPAQSPALPPTVRLVATEPMSLAEVGRVLGLTKERVRQIQDEALAKAGTYLTKRGLSLSDLMDDD